MARLERQRDGGATIVPEDDAERVLLADAGARGGELPLRDALYPISPRGLELPRGLAPGTLETLRRAFARAAIVHSHAVARRQRFRLV